MFRVGRPGGHTFFFKRPNVRKFFFSPLPPASLRTWETDLLVNRCGHDSTSEAPEDGACAQHGVLTKDLHLQVSGLRTRRVSPEGDVRRPDLGDDAHDLVRWMKNPAADPDDVEQLRSQRVRRALSVSQMIVDRGAWV